MPTQEERITTLEHAISEYRPVLQNITYELTMVKGLIVTQTEITHELKQEVKGLKQDVNDMRKRLTHIEDQLETILTLLKPS